MTIAERLKKEGRIEGRNEGRIEEKHAIAMALMAQQVPFEIITRSTGLTSGEISRLSFEPK